MRRNKRLSFSRPFSPMNTISRCTLELRESFAGSERVIALVLSLPQCEADDVQRKSFHRADAAVLIKGLINKVSTVFIFISDIFTQ